MRVHARGNDEVALESGDLLTLGNTQLRYDEIGEVQEPAIPQFDNEDADEDEDEPEEVDATRVVELPQQALHGEDPEEGQTKVIANLEGSPVLPAKYLPGWRSSHDAHAAKRGRLGLVLLIATAIGVAIAGVWFQRRVEVRRNAELVEYRDELVGRYRIDHPARWTVTKATSTEVQFQTEENGPSGKGEGETMAIWADRKARYTDVGLTQGFHEYLEEAAKRHPGFRLLGDKPLTVNDVATIHYGFTTARGEGLGLFILNGETRLVMEGVTSRSRMPSAKEEIIDILQSFQLTSGQAQQCIEFPLPTDEMRRQALSHPEEVDERISELVRQGDNLFDQRSVKADNLHLALEFYRAALQLQLALSGREPSDRLAAMTRKLRIVTRVYQDELSEQVFLLRQALNTGNRQVAQFAALKAIQMAPNKLDPVHREARAALRQIEKSDRRNR
jgi:hypothetical protein